MEDINILIQQFKTQTSNTHPNISQLWITFLEKKKENIANLLIHGQSVLMQLQERKENGDEKIKDPEMDQLINLMQVKMILQ